MLDILKINLSNICFYHGFLQRANDLVRNKIHPTSIISGYRVSFNYDIIVPFLVSV